MSTTTTRQPPGRYLKSRQAADYLTITERHLFNLIAAQKIPVCRRDGRLIIDRMDLDKYVQDGKLKAS